MKWIRWWAGALALTFGLCAVSAQTALPPEEDWLSRFNRERAQSGALPLRPSPVLNQVAQRQAEEMVWGAWQHQRPSATVISEWLRRVGYSAHDWREAYKVSRASTDAVLVSQRESSRVALDGNYRDMGVGTAIADGVTLHVFLFGWHQGDFFARATAGLSDQQRVAAEMLARVNDFRRQQGLPPLAPNPLLDRLSREHAEDMLLRSYFAHRTPEGLAPSERARAAGYPAGIGENIVEARYSAKEALDAWLASPGHRRNILDPDCREMGLGLAVGEGYDAAPGGYRVIWVQSFGRGERPPSRLGGQPAPLDVPGLAPLGETRDAAVGTP